MHTPAKRRLIVVFVLFVVIGLGGYGAWRSATHLVRNRIEKVLGPNGEMRDVRLGLRGLEILDLRLRAESSSGCPEEDELKVRRVRVLPDWFDLLSGRLAIDTVQIEGAHVVSWRTPDGKIRVVPGLFERAAEAPPAQRPPHESDNNGKKNSSIDIGRILVSDGTFAFHDIGYQHTPIRFHVEQIEASLGRLSLPQAPGAIPLKLDGVIKGIRGDGRVGVEGTIDPATKDARLTAKLRDLDLSTMQAYLLKPNEADIDGRLDLDIKLSLDNGSKLRAPGALTLFDLQLSGSGTFLGLPRKAVRGLLKARKGKITVKFVVSGDLDDPRFSAQEQIAQRLVTSLRQAQGMDVRALAESIDGSESETAKAILDAIGQKQERQRDKRRQ